MGDGAAPTAGEGEGAGLANGNDGLGAGAAAPEGACVAAAAGALVAGGVDPPLHAANNPLPPATSVMFRKCRRVRCIRFAA
jgi:hypothetical protein